MTADDVRPLRRQMRSWRRQRADTTVLAQASEAYIWVFSVVVVGAMSTSALIQTRASIAAGCSTARCEDARMSLIWASLAGALAVCLGVAAMLGPVLVTPALGTWLLSTPVDRAALLRARLASATLLSAAACGGTVAVAGLLGGLDHAALIILGVTAAVLGAGVVGAAATSQARSRPTSRRAALLLGAVACAWLLGIAVDRMLLTSGGWLDGPAGWALLIGAVASTIALLGRATRGLRSLRRAQLVPGGSLLSNLSGALAGLDPSLAYDLLVARRWLATATVRPVRGGPGGPWALVWRDVVRLRRSPGAVAAVLASLLIPYVMVALDLGGAAVLAGGLAVFVTGVWLCPALRTTARGSDLVRWFPMSTAVVRAATLVVPAGVLVAWSLAAAPAMAHPVDGGPVVAVSVALAAATAGFAATARWLLAGPPDYSRPLISSPAGAVPTGLVGSTGRGFDVLALAVVPLLVAPDAVGAAISLVLSCSILGYLVTRP